MQTEHKKFPGHIDGLKFSLKVWAASLLVFSLLGLAAWWMFSPIRPAVAENLWGTIPVETGVEGGLLGVWMRWDGIHYLRIAQNGYSEDVLTAFFPLYPLLSRWAGMLLGGSDLAGLLAVSRMSLLMALFFLYQLTYQYFDENTAKKAVIFTVLFPTSVYLFGPYPLSLALMFSLAAVWFALQKKWLLVTVAGLLAGLTYGATVPLAVGLGVIAIQQAWKGTRRLVWFNLVAAGGAPFGTALFLAWRISRGFSDYSAIQLQYWSRIAQPPWMIVQEFERFIIAYTGDADGWVNLTLFLLASVLTIRAFKRIPLALWVYQVAMLILFCSNTTLSIPFCSIGRYLLLMFPLYIETALLVEKRWARLITLTVFLFAALFLAMVYFMWGWLA